MRLGESSRRERGRRLGVREKGAALMGNRSDRGMRRKRDKSMEG